MDNYFFYTCFVIGISCVIYGIYIFIYKRKKVNMEEVMSLFWINIVLKGFDGLSTIFFTKRLGIEYEGNVLARFFMNNLGITVGVIASVALFILLTFFVFITINLQIKNSRGWKVFRIGIILTGILVPILNVITAL